MYVKVVFTPTVCFSLNQMMICETGLFSPESCFFSHREKFKPAKRINATHMRKFTSVIGFMYVRLEQDRKHRRDERHPLASHHAEHIGLWESFPSNLRMKKRMPRSWIGMRTDHVPTANKQLQILSGTKPRPPPLKGLGANPPAITHAQRNRTRRELKQGLI